MGYRYNERNGGGITLNGEPKRRRTLSKKQPLTEQEITLLKEIVEKVLDCLQYDKELSGVGHLSPDAKYVDGGRFCIMLSRKDMESLTDASNKL